MAQPFAENHLLRKLFYFINGKIPNTIRTHSNIQQSNTIKLTGVTISSIP